MIRRTLIGLIGSAALTWPFRGGAQQPAKIRRVGVLLGQSEATAGARARFIAFRDALAELGWAEGRNLQMDVRWTGGDVTRASQLAKELVALKPDVIATTTTAVTAAVQRETRSIPIIFVAVSDPVGSGLVKTLAQPGGNITGFVDLEPSLIAKELELLLELAPHLKRVAIMFNPDTATYADVYLRHMKTATPRLRVQTFVATVRSPSDIEQAIGSLGREPGAGLVVMPDSFMGVHHKLTTALAAKHKVAATYFAAPWVEGGGLSAYGPDVMDLRRRAAGYVDRVLRGANPADLPVQQPTKFELLVNLKTAQAMGITIPQSVLVRADRIIDL